MSQADETVDGASVETSTDFEPAEQQSPVGRAMDALADIEATPLADHPDVYQQIHTTLHDALAEIDGS